MLDIWSQRSGYSFGTFNERAYLNVLLPLKQSPAPATTFTVISGALPSGLRISGMYITGVPAEVPRDTTYTFCIRAQLGYQISDRTFTIEIVGPDSPRFITPEGPLNIGTNEQYFVLDSSYVDFQIEAIDTDTAAGQTVNFFIASDDGELPPGLSLTNDGRIVGFVEPAFAIKITDGDGSYDNGLFDAVAYDFGYRPTNGYDSFVYDQVFYDFSLPNKTPKKLNRNYEFRVTITDGDTIAYRTFRIFVVGDDYFRADNITYQAASGMFSADTTYLREPIWTTPEFLGTYRASNYLSFILDTYQAATAGVVIYSMTDEELLNLPPGMQFDPTTSEIFGFVPYQTAVSKTYSWTVVATRYGTNDDVVSVSRTFSVTIIGEVDSVITWNTDPDLGSIDANYISTLKISANSSISDAVVIYTVVSGSLPTGLTLNLDGEIIGKVNQYAVMNDYIVTQIVDGGNVSSEGLIVVDGGNAFSTGPALDGGSNSMLIQPGLTRFYDVVNGEQVFTTFDNNDTTVDRKYTFVVQARDQYGYSASTRTFTLYVNTPNDRLYSNIITKPFLKLDQRALWKDFITDSTVFTPDSIYRPNDPSFGIQKELKMLVYAGIETKESAAYIGAIGLNHKKKKFLFGSVKKALAILPGTKTAVYEVVYVEMIDPLEPRGKHLPARLNELSSQNYSITVDNEINFWDSNEQQLRLEQDRYYKDRPDPLIRVDSEGFLVSNSTPNTYFANSITNWRDRIKSIPGAESERNYLPLWMRSIQPGSKQELDYQKALPICYCKVGAADDIILNIKHSGFDFKSLEYTVDRYIIDSVEGYTQDKYLVFKNDRITV